MTEKNIEITKGTERSQPQKHDGVVADEKNLTSSSPERTDTADVIGIIRLLLGRKKFIILATAIITIASVIVSYIIPETFKSTSIILPETDKSKLAGLGGLSDLASLAGVSAGDASAIKLYPAILKSETVLRTVIYKKYQTNEYKDSVNLIEFWKIKAKTPELAYETALYALREALDVSIDVKTNIITLTLDAEEPNLAANIINSVTAELDKFMRTKRTTNAMKQRQWIEARLIEVKQDLTTSENRVKDFREKNRSVAGSPLLLLEQDRLLREVQINASLFSELKKQFELIKIEEIKNTPIVSIMDAAVPAAKKDKPKRSIIVLTSFFLALAGSAGYVYVQRYYSGQIKTFVAQLKK